MSEVETDSDSVRLTVSTNIEDSIIQKAAARKAYHAHNKFHEGEIERSELHEILEQFAEDVDGEAGVMKFKQAVYDGLEEAYVDGQIDEEQLEKGLSYLTASGNEFLSWQEAGEISRRKKSIDAIGAAAILISGVSVFVLTPLILSPALLTGTLLFLWMKWRDRNI